MRKIPKKKTDKCQGFLDHLLKCEADAVPFCHCEFRIVERADFSIAKHVANLVNVTNLSRKESFHPVFRGRVKIACLIFIESDFHDIDMQIDGRGRRKRGTIDFEDVSSIKKFTRL